MPENGKLQITSSTSSSIGVYSECGDIENQYGYQNVTTDGIAGNEAVFIKLNTAEGGNFDWDLSVVPLDPGEDCVSAVAATAGTNSLPATVDSEYWHNYTMPSDGELQITAPSSQQADIYRGECDDLRYDSYLSGGATTMAMAAGEVVSIRWNTDDGGNFDWDLSVTPFELGELLCVGRRSHHRNQQPTSYC